MKSNNTLVEKETGYSDVYLLSFSVMSLICLTVNLPFLSKCFLIFVSFSDDLIPHFLLLLFLFLEIYSVLPAQNQ